MGRLSIESTPVPNPPASSQPASEEILAELTRLLASPAFVGSRRSQQFLQYICLKALEGKEGTLKERTIAVEVFGRSLNADLGEDTIVRVGAREVRKRLTQFYSQSDAAESKVRIGLPSGSYVPEFRYPDLKPAPEPSPPPVPPPASSAVRPKLTWIYLALAASALLAFAWVLSTRPRLSDSAFERFWGPVFTSAEPLLVVVSNPLVYHASARAHKLSEGRLPPMELPLQRPIQVKPEELNGSDLVAVHNQYVGFGDMVVGTEIAAMLARHKKGVRVRLASSVPFADLRQSQSLLIGAITNRWTMELGRRWRFQFLRGADLSTVIGDTHASPSKVWKVQSSDDGSVTEDYVLISRIVHSTSGGLQIVAAGIKQFGTEAAGRVLTDPAHLRALVAKLPSGWETKNLQLVLHVKVIGNAPDQPELIAAHVW